MINIGTYKLLIRETHLDTYGHVNNATYLTMYEEARWDAITHRGYDFEKIHQSGQGPVILEVHLKFMKELRLREEIRITTELVDYPGKIGHLKQQMIKPNGTIASEAVFTFGLFDLNIRKMIEATPEWKKAIGL
jgi:acyl-CoA thioester hydrolase